MATEDEGEDGGRRQPGLAADAAPQGPSRQRYRLVDTDIGAIGLAWSAAGLTRLLLPEAERRATVRQLRNGRSTADAADPPAPIREVVDALRRYCRGEKVDFGCVALDLDGVAPFCRKVYAAARRIPWGATASYGDLARRIAKEGAQRAVGRALGQNPIAIIIPCHRVLASGGKIGGFSAFGGTTAKRRLLALEGVGDVAPLFGLPTNQ